MSSSAFFSLKGSKVFCKNRLLAYSELHKIIKNSMLFFDEIIFESGMQQTTYGDTITFDLHGPFKGMEFYLPLRESYAQDTEEKKTFCNESSRRVW
ncbi:MAG: hypothetical protein ACTSQY_10330 [Candidatus Odinarchaeia archaeon]